MSNIKVIREDAGNNKDNDAWESSGFQLNTGTSNDTSGGGCRTPVGILRLDLAHSPKVASPAAARLSPIELKFLSQIEPTSPQPSVDRLSVTFAEDSAKTSTYNADEKSMDKVHFPCETQVEGDDSNEEDYSGSVMAIMKRRASVRQSKKRRGRRGSSPFSPDILPEMENGRRRSSGFTISSGDTAITMEDSLPAVSQEQIFENIKLHKEVLSSVKMQPWNMRRKLRLVQQAKAYIKKHEGALQERLAQSHSTKDMLARWNIYLVKKLQRLKREIANASNWLIPWESKIKEIESHFGSVVASYFIFLRWLFWVNIAISAIWIAFTTIPELLTTDINISYERKSILLEDKYNATNFLTLWDFEGVLKYSPMFYGWYTNATHAGGNHSHSGYRLPLAYFITGLAVYIFSFVATLRKMAENSRMSKLSEKEDECIFSWKLFTGWDYMIGNVETATNRVASINMGFKEALLEEAEKKRKATRWKVIGSRIMVNISIITLLALSALAVIKVVARSKEKGATSTWRRNEITIVMTLISFFFPMFFELFGCLEYYHPRKQLRLQLARIMILNLSNLYSLIFALFDKINDTQECELINTGSCIISSNDTDFLSVKETTLDRNLPLQVGSLVRGLLVNASTTMPSTWELANSTILTEISNLTDFNTTTSDLYNFFTNTTTNLAFEYFGNASDISGTTPSFESPDFSRFQDALQEFLTTIISTIENIKSIPVNETYFEETLSTLLETTTNLDPSLPSLETETTTFTQLADISTSQASTESPQNFTMVTPVLNKISDHQRQTKLRSMCWETMFGQELVKLTVMDLIMTVLFTLGIDFFRGLFVRYMNNCWCWDLEKKFPQYGDFKVAENILHLVNNQGMVWMGMFFSPGLVVINVVKLYVMMYFRSWAVLTCNVPPEKIFRASRSNNFYYALLLMMLFLCVLPVSYALVWLKPSENCGPFSKYEKIYYIFTETLRDILPASTHKFLNYIASPSTVIPLLMLLVLIIYYLISLSGALREANNDLKIQLRRERTEERRKMFQIVDRRRRGGSDTSETNNPFGKWKKLLRDMPSNKSFEDTPKQTSLETPGEPASIANRSSLSKFIFRAIENHTANSTKPNPEVKEKQQQNQDEATDTGTHSLSEDLNTNRTTKSRVENKSGKPSAKPSKAQEKRSTAVAGKKSRKDSNASNWSEQIPVITISKTESSECILENKPKEAIQIDVVKSNNSPKIRYVLKKQPVVETEAAVKKREEIISKEEGSVSALSGERSEKPEISKAAKNPEKNETEDQKSEVGREAGKVFQESSSSTQTIDMHTESSTDYRDSTLSN